MNYEMQCRNDFLTGAYLVVRIPENELDQCALNTIQADCPDFIIPFHFKNTDGQIEFIYKTGALCKLNYFSGELSPNEYAELWQSMLKPLLDCVDWFMNPCSFVLNTDYLYYDKRNKTISYVYIPSAYGCSGYDAFYEMAVEVSKMMSVSDAILENKVLKAIINDFNPVEFLQMIKDYAAESPETPQVLPILEYQDESELPVKLTSARQRDKTDNADVDIWTDIKLEQNKKERDTGGFKLFGRRKSKKLTQDRHSPPEMQTEKSTPEMLPQKSLPEKLQLHDLSETTFINDEFESPPSIYPECEGKNHVDIIDITQSVSTVLSGTGLRYVGRAHLPPSIQIMISEGEIFTIGRFDAAIGKKQSNFEFERKTKAISRRHAVIERDIEGYKIVDLSSSAGTFVNDKKIPPNTPYGLETGYRVSFGNSGADYVWENN
ncbi:MAG: FHA domain-containing protein [Oscillospiraceae bacterium]|nr:FHA domain-containing protein [Oscillospiraceae bacterium]